MDTEKFFPPSNPLHDEPDQLKRQKGALKLNVQSVDTATATGKINDYDVSLDSCSCIDFSRRGVPCKHMYRLAHELGFFQLTGNVVNDATTKNHLEKKKDIQSLVADVISLSDEEKSVLYHVMYVYIYGDKHASVYNRSDIPLCLFEKNLITHTDCDMYALSSYIRKDYLSSLVREHSLPIKLNGKKSTILEILKDNHQDVFQQILDDVFFVIPSSSVMESPRKIYSLVLPPREEYDDLYKSFT